MKRFVFIIVLFCFATFAYAGQEEFFQAVSATDTNTTVTISLVQSGNLAHSVTIVNDDESANNVHYTTSSDVATTDDAYLKPGEARTIDSGGGKFPITVIGVICDSGETATVRIYALPSY